MKHQEINKIDAVRDLLFGAEMSSIQEQFKEMGKQLEKSQTSTQNKLEKKMDRQIASLEEKMSQILNNLAAVDKKVDALSKSAVDRKRLQGLFGELVKKV